MFLKQKLCGQINGQGCTDGQKQQIYKTKDETSSPTISTDALFLTSLIDTMGKCHVVTCDVPGVFMWADIEEVFHLKLEGEIAKMLINVDPSYAPFMTKQQGKTLIYTTSNKALYSTLQAMQLFWKDLSKSLWMALDL